MYLKKSKTIVIKLGSALLVSEKQIFRQNWLENFAKDVKELLNKKKNIIIVSSGAIA